MSPQRMRVTSLYVLIFLNLLVLVVTVGSVAWTHSIDDRVSLSRTAARAQCERFNDVRAVLRLAFQDPAVLTPRRIQLARDPAIQQKNCNKLFP